MSGGPGRTILWVVASGLLLVLGFATLLAVAGRLASGDAEAVQQTRQALALYGAVILLKGLLPVWALGLLLYAAAGGRLGLARSRSRLALGLASCALVAAALVAGFVLPLDLWGLAAIRYTGPLNLLATWVELGAAVAAAYVVPRLLLELR